MAKVRCVFALGYHQILKPQITQSGVRYRATASVRGKTHDVQRTDIAQLGKTDSRQTSSNTKTNHLLK